MSNLTREAKGRDIAENGDINVLPDGAGYYVGDYHVDCDATECTCNDFVYRGGRCKHLLAIDYAESVGLLDEPGDDDCVDFDDLPF